MSKAKRDEQQQSFNLKGHCLIAMPGMGDDRFARSVILICSHDNTGSMGFIINQPVVSPLFTEVLDELDLKEQSAAISKSGRSIPIHRGGPVEKGRGFVLHSLDFSTSATAKIDDTTGLSATLDVLRALSGVNPPERSLMLLGYSGWSAGQLEREIAENGWLTVKATDELLFETEPMLKYDKALSCLGVSEAALSGSAGHA